MGDLLKALTISEIKSKFKISPDKVYIENGAFRLFSRFTSGCLFLCAGLVTLQQLVGKHIDCIVPPKEDIRPEALNQYCFIMGTYTVPDLYNATLGVEVAHPGVGTYLFSDSGEDEEENQHFHRWYQWVPIALFFQGITFLVPHVLWKALEKERIKAYCDLKVADEVTMKTKFNLNANSDPDKKQKAISRAAIYFVGNMKHNNFYAYAYVFCEWLNLAVLAFNFLWTNWFLGENEFFHYGPEVLAFHREQNNELKLSPQDRVFPKVSKCDFQKYGPSGGLIRYDIMCVLAINIINEKIYLFLWFWFITLFCVGALAVLYRVVMFTLPGLRNLVLRRRTEPRYMETLNHCLERMTYADWFVLKRLNANINSIRFGELCEGIWVELTHKTPIGRLSPSSLPGYSDSFKDVEDYDENNVHANFIKEKH